MLNISGLKLKWNKEKDSYMKQEVGSGAQKFIKDMLKSEELFNLAEGSISTKLEHRKNEFTEESKTKAARKADIVIYINPEIVIPVEVEKYDNIEAGFNQLMQYQSDLDKKYGILTDGFSWRFYNNAYLLKEFTIDEIFSNAKLFLDFWQEYIKPEFYYLSFFEDRGQLKFLPEDLSVERKRQDFFRDITTLIRGLKNKLDIEGYFKGLEKKEKEKRAVETTYAYIIQFILYKTLVDNKYDDYEKEYKKRYQEIYECLQANNYGKILGIIGGISQNISQNIYRPFKKEQDYISHTLLKLFHEPKNYLHDVSPWLDIFIFIKKYDFANVKNEIFGYIYENYLKELYEDTKKGQYFTDPAVVNFMLDQVGYTAMNVRHTMYYDRYGERDFKCNISIIDPSCGCGTFLYSAVDRIMAVSGYAGDKAPGWIGRLINESVFGLDIEEFPLYLAEMNILMRMLPIILFNERIYPVPDKLKVFKTNDSLAEFLDTAIKNTVNDMDVAYHKSNGQMSLFAQKLNLGYASYVRDEDGLAEMKKSLENNKIPRRRFDFVVGNPPYISFKECSKQKTLFFELMKQKKIKLSDVYGVNLHSTPDNKKKYAPNPNLYAFFIALGLALLKDGAKLCYIVPQTLLTAGDLDVLRYHLAKFTTIEKIITFSGKMFIGRGLKQNKPVATSSLVFVVRRQASEPAHKVEVIHYKNPNDDIEKCLANILAYNHKKILFQWVLQNKLFQNASNWNFIKQDKKFLDFYEAYKNNTEDISIYYNHSAAEYNFKSRFYFDRGLKYPKNKIKKLSFNGESGYYIANSNKNKFIANASENFISSNLLDFPFGSQGEVVYKQKYKIIWRYINYDCFRFSSEKIMIDYNNVLISSDNKNELLYLLAIFNSSIVSKVFDALLKNENEKDILIGIKTIKEFVRVPKITEDNQFIKDEIIKKTEEMLKLEDIILSDLADFSGLTLQKFDNVEIEGDNLVLAGEGKKYKCKIFKDKYLAEKTIREKLSNKKLFGEKINLADLKYLPAVDFDGQKKIKDYIDDLVFALYFNALVKEVGLDRAGEIKKKCGENKFYKMTEKESK